MIPALGAFVGLLGSSLAPYPDTTAAQTLAQQTLRLTDPYRLAIRMPPCWIRNHAGHYALMPRPRSGCGLCSIDAEAVELPTGSIAPVVFWMSQRDSVQFQQLHAGDVVPVGRRRRFSGAVCLTRAVLVLGGESDGAPRLWQLGLARLRDTSRVWRLLTG